MAALNASISSRPVPVGCELVELNLGRTICGFETSYGNIVYTIYFLSLNFWCIEVAWINH